MEGQRISFHFSDLKSDSSSLFTLEFFLHIVIESSKEDELLYKKCVGFFVHRDFH